MVDPDFGGACVVSLRAKPTDHNATHELLDILATFTPVALIASNLTPDAALRDDYEVTDVGGVGRGYLASTLILRYLRLQYRLCRAIISREEKMILFFGVTAYVLPVLLARVLGKTVIIEPRGDVPLTLRLRWTETMPEPVAVALATGVRILELVSYAAASGIITYTPAMADELGLRRFSEKLYTQGARHVDVDRFRPTVPYAVREPVVGYVGRLDVEKGVETLIEVAAGLPDGIGFLFVGDGAHRERMEARLTDAVEAGRVEFIGWVDHDEVPQQINRLRLLVMPSAPTEGLPTTILEAFACGTPVYARPVSGVPDVVIDGQTGFRMRSTDPEQVITRIEAILERGDLPDISDAARTLIEEEYTFEATVDRYREMFREIV